MKSKIFVFAVFIILFAFSYSLSMDIIAEMVGPIYHCPGPIIMVLYPYTLEIYIRNDDNFTRQYMTMPLTFYGTGNIIQIQHVNVGGYGSTGSIELLNGFESGGFFDTDVQLIEFGWDGNLIDRDGICYMGSASQGNGFPSGPDSLHAMSFHFYIVGDDNTVGNFCIDSTGFGDPYDWIFEDPSPSFGPICWGAMMIPDCAIVMDNCPTIPLVTQYGSPFYYDFDASGWCLGPPYGPYYAIYQGPGIIDSMTGVWTYTPDISQAGDTLTLVISPYTCFNQPPTREECYVELRIASACGDLNGDYACNIFDVVHLIGYLYLDGEGPHYYYHADVNGSGSLDIFDVTDMISNLYMGGDDLGCQKIRDDFPMVPGNWWQYERISDITFEYDTIMVSILDPYTWVYTFSDAIDTQYIDIKADTVSASGIYPEKMNMFPLIVGRNWVNPITGSSDTVISNYSFDTPAGHFDNVFMIRSHWVYGEEGVARRTEWFKPGVGMIKLYLWDNDLMSGPIRDESWTLIDYDIIP